MRNDSVILIMERTCECGGTDFVSIEHEGLGTIEICKKCGTSQLYLTDD